MVEIKFHGRFGQPVGKLVRSLGRRISESGRHVQIFDAFASYRPGAPMYSVIRVADDFIRERSANNTDSDLTVVLDNSLFQAFDLLKGLPKDAVVMALGADPALLGENKAGVNFVPLDSFFSNEEQDLEQNLLLALKQQGVL